MKLFSTSIPQQYLCIFILWAYFHHIEFRRVLLWCQWEQVWLRATPALQVLSDARGAGHRRGPGNAQGCPGEEQGCSLPLGLTPNVAQTLPPGWEVTLKLCVLEGHIKVTDPLNSDMRAGGVDSFHPVYWEHFHGQGSEWGMGTDGNMLEGGGEKLHLVMG